MNPTDRDTPQPRRAGFQGWRWVFASSIAGLCVAAGLTSIRQAEAQRPAAADAPAHSVSVTDDTGRTVTFTEPATKIAVVNPFAVQVLEQLGVVPVLRPELPANVSEPLADVPVMALTHSAGPSLEQLIASQPDLVITSPTYGAFSDRIAQATGAKVLSFEIDSIEDYMGRVHDLGQIVAKPDEAKELIRSARARLEHVPAGRDAGRPRVFALFGAPGSFYAFHQDSFLGDLVDVSGGQMIPTGSPNKTYAQLASFSLESVIASDPDVILVVSHLGGGRTVDQLAADPGWSTLRAVRTGAVYSISEERTIIAPGMDLFETLNEVRDSLAASLAAGLAGAN